jgi:N-acetylneuraminic acid mutarotase
LLQSGQVLVAGGQTSGGAYLTAAEIYDPANDSWSLTGNLATDRGGQTSVLLKDGRVLVAGGNGGPSVAESLTSAEIYNPTTGVWSSAGNMANGRVGHTATLLPNGTVLVAGGFSGSVALSGAEIYDPVANIWSRTESLPAAIVSATATLLQNGLVLVAGGGNGSGSASAELYNSTTGTWSAAASMSDARQGHTATLLPNGTVLVAGGVSGNTTLTSAEIYNPGTNSWSSAGDMASGRYAHTATLLAGGLVLVAGGTVINSVSTTILASAELFDPSTNTWSMAASMSAPRASFTATLLSTGGLIVAGGTSLDQTSSVIYINSSEIYW